MRVRSSFDRLVRQACISANFSDRPPAPPALPPRDAPAPPPLSPPPLPPSFPPVDHIDAGMQARAMKYELRDMLSRTPPRVSWRADAHWFADRLKLEANLANSSSLEARGCCPAAVRIYGSRRGFRCCREKRHLLLPLRPFGGMSWDEVARSVPSGRLLVLSGDSMVEQQLVALLCMAWASRRFAIKAAAPRPAAEGRVLTIGTVRELCREASAATPCWHMHLAHTSLAQVVDFGARPGEIELPASLAATEGSEGEPDAAGQFGGETSSIVFDAKTARLVEILWRRTRTGTINVSALAVLSQASALLIGGWHHAVPRGVAALRRLRARLRRPLPRLPVLFVEALPPHFPDGGDYQSHTRCPAPSAFGAQRTAQPAAPCVCYR